MENIFITKKFRAWDEFGYMVQPFYFMKTGDEGGDWIIWGRSHAELVNSITNPFPVQQFHIMQYIPVPDCDGKELYEGDIVCARRQRDCFSEEMKDLPQFQPYDEYRIVKFKVDNESISLFLTLEGNYNERGNPAQWRLVGNVYQNPELIELCVNK
jgi:uncharacterized phage protein (TIGR01671 family)